MKRYPLNDGWYFTEQFTRQLTTLEKPEPELVPVRLPSHSMTSASRLTRW